MKRKTYAETRNATITDWNTSLELLSWLKPQEPAEYKLVMQHHMTVNKYSIYFKEYNEYCKLAMRWSTCACGIQCDVIPRGYNGRPLDKKLYKLGSNFSIHIKKHDFKKAIATLEQIEYRSIYLINKINQSKSKSKKNEKKET